MPRVVGWSFFQWKQMMVMVVDLLILVVCLLKFPKTDELNFGEVAKRSIGSSFGDFGGDGDFGG